MAMKIDPNITVDAIRDAVREQIAGLQTETLTVQKLGHYLSVSRNKASKWVRSLSGAERVPGGWRVPLWVMPPRYLVEKGILEVDALICTDLHRERHEQQTRR